MLKFLPSPCDRLITEWYGEGERGRKGGREGEKDKERGSEGEGGYFRPSSGLQ